MDYGTSSNAAMSSGLFGLSLIQFFLFMALAVLVIVGWWKTFEKAGEPGWAAIVPLYNEYTLFKLAWGNGWLFLLLLIPVVNVVIQIIVTIKLGKAFGKSTLFILGLIFLAPFFTIALGFDDSTYLGPQTK